MKKITSLLKQAFINSFKMNTVVCTVTDFDENDEEMEIITLRVHHIWQIVAIISLIISSLCL